MFAHQNDGNSLSKFPKNAVAGIDMMPDACIRERSLLKHGLRVLLVYVVEGESTYVANGLRHVQSRVQCARAKRNAGWSYPNT